MPPCSLSHRAPADGHPSRPPAVCRRCEPAAGLTKAIDPLATVVPAGAGCPRRQATGSRSEGFTLLEMLFVVSLIAVMLAISVPSILNATAHAQLRGASSSLAGLIQSSRMQAVKRNRTLSVRFMVAGGVPFAVAKDAEDSSSEVLSTDPQVQLGPSTYRVAAVPAGDAPPLTDATLSYTPLNLPDVISLSPRGLPCKYASGVCTPAGFIYYLTDTRHRNAWAAVSISPGGRVKQWVWNGNRWAD